MNLLIKGFPDNLADQLKQEALRLKVSLKDLVIKKCSDVALRDSESTPKRIKPGAMLRVEGVKAPGLAIPDPGKVQELLAMRESFKEWDTCPRCREHLKIGGKSSRALCSANPEGHGDYPVLEYKRYEI